MYRIFHPYKNYPILPFLAPAAVKQAVFLARTGQLVVYRESAGKMTERVDTFTAVCEHRCNDLTAYGKWSCEHAAQSKGDKPDLAEARRLLLGLAAVQDEAEAQATLGKIGKRVTLGARGKMNRVSGPVDLAEVRQLLGIAAAHGDVDAQAALGGMYYHGQGGPKDFAEARRLYGFAAAQGDAKAQAILGSMYSHGTGGPKDFAEAWRLFELAATQGEADAQAKLGSMHYNGKGGLKDMVEARRLFELAAAQGHANAQFMLGYFR